MRDILVEQARRKARPVRGGGRRRQELDEACALLEPTGENVLAVGPGVCHARRHDRLTTGTADYDEFAKLWTCAAAWICERKRYYRLRIR
jgi:hypothetical protein